jgi:hypothetical protein
MAKSGRATVSRQFSVENRIHFVERFSTWIRKEIRHFRGGTALPIERDPDHPIIQKPWTYEIILFSYSNDPRNYKNSFIDLSLQRDDEIRRLRFLAPQDLKIEPGFPHTTGGMAILDVRERQLDGLGVRVADFEASWGAVTFWARDVIDLDRQDAPAT